MATTSNSGASKPATTAKASATTAKTTARKGASATKSAARSTRTTARKSAAGTKSAATRSAGTRSTARRSTSSRTTSSSTSTQPKTVVEQAQVIAERAVLVPVGASLLARENLVSTVKVLSTKYGTRASVERELKRYERRGASARNRFERQVRRTRTKFERELRQRRSTRRAHGEAEPPSRRARGPDGAQGSGEAVRNHRITGREARVRRPDPSERDRVALKFPPPGALESAPDGQGSPASYPRRRM